MQSRFPASSIAATVPAVQANGAQGHAVGSGNSFHPVDGMPRGGSTTVNGPHLSGHASRFTEAGDMSRMRAPLRSDCAVGREIRELRRAKMMTQKDLALLVGVTGAQLHRYETGTTRIAASRLIAIADALEVGPERLIAAASTSTSPTSAPSHHGGDDLLDLIQIFSAISDPRCRAAIMTVVRMLANQHPGQAPETTALL